MTKEIGLGVAGGAVMVGATDSGGWGSGHACAFAVVRGVGYAGEDDCENEEE